ncbi:uncharacterized protein YALI1_A18204g [Yarrowia lipolytica]|uniref:Secreted protein n=1 Tax=Yarrowia lipolytica TaxID=4952 RepID=A0A1D8N586_YARLL|nr:hypothetical protein YALI1_A18204g [Yarrowia lipolytica]
MCLMSLVWAVVSWSTALDTVPSSVERQCRTSSLHSRLHISHQHQLLPFFHQSGFESAARWMNICGSLWASDGTRKMENGSAISLSNLVGISWEWVGLVGTSKGLRMGDIPGHE